MPRVNRQIGAWADDTTHVVKALELVSSSADPVSAIVAYDQQAQEENARDAEIERATTRAATAAGYRRSTDLGFFHWPMLDS
jgi:hypothetical protein